MLRLFGYPTLESTSQTQELPPYKPACLLVYLAVQQGWVSREVLATLFWPDTDEAGARRNLRMMLSRIRDESWASGLEIAASQCRWQGTTDYQLFREALGAGDWAGAISLHRAPLLADWRVPDVPAFEEWLELEREDSLSAWRDASLKHVSLLREQQSYAEMSRLLGSLLRVNPLEEDILQAYLEAAYLAGQRDDALKMYQRFVTLLRQELDLEPLQKTQQLATMIQQAAPLTLRDLAPIPDIPLSLRRPPHLLGRDRQRAMLEACRQPVILVTGEAGTGKSRFVQDTVPGAIWLYCREGLENVPYYPLLPYLQSLETLPDLGAYLLDLARLLPERFPGAPAEAESLTAKTRLLEALVQIFEAQARPVVIEDMQWADEATLEFLLYLSARWQERLYGSYRSNESSAQLQKCLLAWQASQVLQTIEIGALSVRDIAALIASLSGVATGPERFSDWLQQRTGGNIFFVLETLKTLFEAGILLQKGGHWLSTVDDLTQDYSEIEIPSSVREVIERRIYKLPEAVQRILQVASVIARDFSVTVLAKIAGLSEWAVMEALEQLEAAGIITDEQFVHDLFRQTVYAGLSSSKRKALHLQVADLLKDTLEPALVAGHYKAAGQLAVAADYFLQAARSYQARGLHHEAIALLKQLIDTNPDEAIHHQAKLELLGNYVELGLFMEAEALLEPLLLYPDLHVRARALNHKVIMGLEQGNLRSVAEDFDKLSGLALTLTPDEQIQRRLLEVQLTFYQDRFEECLRLSQEVLMILRQQAPSIELANTLTNIGAVLDSLTRHDEARHYHREALQVARVLQAPHIQIAMMINLLWNAQTGTADDLPATIDLAEEMLHYGEYSKTMTLRTNIASAYMQLKQDDKAQPHYEYIARHSPDPTLRAIAWARLAAFYQVSRPAEVQQALEQALLFCQQTDFKIAHLRVGISTLYHGSDAQLEQILPLLTGRFDFESVYEEELREALAQRGLDYPLLL